MPHNPRLHWHQPQWDYFWRFPVLPGCPSPTDSEVNRILSLLAVSENAVPESAEGILRVNFSQTTNRTYSYVKKKKIRRVVNDLAILQLVNNWVYTFWLSNYFWTNKIRIRWWQLLLNWSLKESITGLYLHIFHHFGCLEKSKLSTP